MIGTENLLSDKCVLKAWEQAMRDEEIIDAPPDIPFTCFCEVAPPGILFRCVWIEMPECIDKSTIDEFLESCALLIGEASIPTIRFWVCEVNLLMRHIEITANDDWFECLELFQMIEEKRVPELTILKTFQFPL